MRISDWSSDVCSSDLLLTDLQRRYGAGIPRAVSYSPTAEAGSELRSPGVKLGPASTGRRLINAEYDGHQAVRGTKGRLARVAAHNRGTLWGNVPRGTLRRWLGREDVGSGQKV